MDAFAGYDNTIGFFIGNEVIDSTSQSSAAPYIKAAASDLKLYRDSKGYRKFPVGYAAADISGIRPQLQNFLACGAAAPDAAIDFYSLNSYEWCGNSTFEQSGYENLQNISTGYNLPLFFSETGCNASPPRTFDDQDAILGSDMDDVWSGAIIYEWIQESNSYGLISYGTSAASDAAATTTDSAVQGGYTRTGTPTPITPDFTNLQSHWATLTPTGTPSASYSPSLSPPACPTSESGGWGLDGDVAIPTLGLSLTAASGSSTVTRTTTSSGTGSADSSSQTNGAGAGAEKAWVGMMSLSVTVGVVLCGLGSW